MRNVARSQFQERVLGEPHVERCIAVCLPTRSAIWMVVRSHDGGSYLLAPVGVFPSDPFRLVSNHLLRQEFQETNSR